MRRCGPVARVGSKYRSGSILFPTCGGWKPPLLIRAYPKIERWVEEGTGARRARGALARKEHDHAEQAKLSKLARSISSALSAPCCLFFRQASSLPPLAQIQFSLLPSLPSVGPLLFTRARIALSIRPARKKSPRKRQRPRGAEDTTSFRERLDGPAHVLACRAVGGVEAFPAPASLHAGKSTGRPAETLAPLGKRSGCRLRHSAAKFGCRFVATSIERRHRRIDSPLVASNEAGR